MFRNRTKIQSFGLLAGPVVFFLIIMSNFAPENYGAVKMAACASWMAIWWMTEAIPLAATALLPMIIFPLTGLMTAKATAPVYFNSTIFLFLGGFMIAIAMEKWNLHKRIALIIIKGIGTGPSGMILGFMAACYLLSMYISNTATTIMMLPIGLAVISKIGQAADEHEVKKFSTGLMLGIAYASSIGGISTLVGTAPNLVFLQIYSSTFPAGPEITFGNWMFFGIPLSLTMLALTWLLLTKLFYKVNGEFNLSKKVINDEYRSLGKISYEEKSVLIVFIITGLLWIFRKDIEVGIFNIPGWTDLLPFGKNIDDGAVAIFMAFVLFLIPPKNSTKITGLIGLKDIPKIPWDIILLFGGGFAVAKGFQTSGLSDFFGNQFSAFSNVHPILVIIVVCTGLTFLTELTSNTATTQTILPILASVSIGLKINPLLLMIPAAISASFAFMLPVATPPNAIVFGSGKVKIGDMVKTGIFLNFIGIIVISLLFYFLGSHLFGIDESVFPDWAG